MTTVTFRTNLLTLHYKGTIYSIHYWADGHGRHVPDYATSVVQLRTLLHKKLSSGPLDFYCIMDKKKRPITTDKHIIQALEDVPNGGSLAVYAYEHKDIDFSKLFSNTQKKKDEPTKKEEENKQAVIIKKEVIKKNVTKLKKKTSKKTITTKKTTEKKTTLRRPKSPPQLQVINPRIVRLLPVN